MELYQKNKDDVVLCAQIMAQMTMKTGTSILRRWWCQKYNRPVKELNDYTLDEILVEFFEDYYIDNPQEKAKFERDHLGEISLPDLGDPQIARWERQIMQGIDPDLTEGMHPKEREKVIKLMEERQKAVRGKEVPAIDANEYLKEFDNLNEEF